MKQQIIYEPAMDNKTSHIMTGSFKSKLFRSALPDILKLYVRTLTSVTEDSIKLWQNRLIAEHLRQVYQLDI